MKKNQYYEGQLQPESPAQLPMPKVGQEVWDSLGETAMNLIDINKGNRASLDAELDLWNAMYEMRTEERSSPWPNAANINIPLIPSELEELVSRIAGSAILPRPLGVRGNDPNSAQYSHTVEQFYNGEYQRYNWEDKFHTGIHLTARDGTSVMEILWDLSTTERNFIVDSVDDQGQPIKIRQKQKFVDYNAPKLDAVELRDFLLIPAFATSIEEADAVCRKTYMSEKSLKKLVNSGILDKDAVESALSYVSTGQGELGYDDQGHSTYNIGGLVDVVDVAVSPPDGITMSRGPLEVWRIHTSQYDLDNDGIPEENILWVHDRSRKLLGFAPFEYLQGRPFKALSMFPRPNRFYGFSTPQRLKGLQEELNAQHNGRLDLMDWILNPTIVKDKMVRLREEDMAVGPGTMIDAKPGDISFLTAPEVPQSSWQEEQAISMYAKQIMGAPQTAGIPTQGGSGGGGGNRQSARQAQQNSAIQGMQTNMVIKRVRTWMLEIFQYIHGLYIQYGKDQLKSVDQTPGGAQRVEIPKEVLALDYTLTIAGMGGPLDKESRRNDLMMMASFLMQLPLVQGNLARIWSIAAEVLSTYDIPEITRFLGTMEEAQQQQQQQAEAQQQQMQMQMAMAAINHGKAETSPGSADSAGAPPHNP